MSEEAKITRRQLLARTAAVGAGLVALGAGLPGCQTKKDKEALVKTGVVNVGPASDYPAGTASDKFLKTYGIELTNESGPVLAIHPMCTYDATMTQWNDEHVEFVCPTCRSRFNILGQVAHTNKGPARKPLPGIETTKNADGTLSVDLDQLYKNVAEVTPNKDAAKKTNGAW